MKTTIDQALNKVFQQPPRTGIDPPRPDDVVPAATGAGQGEGTRRQSKGTLDEIELYVDPPQPNLRPAHPTPCCAAPRPKPRV